MAKRPMIGACGLVCEDCPLYIASSNPEVAGRLSESWRCNGLSDVPPGQFRCSGCHGEGSSRWRENCPIADCCISARKLDRCSRCEEFPCRMLRAWSQGATYRTEALARLQRERMASGMPPEGPPGTEAAHGGSHPR